VGRLATAAGMSPEQFREHFAGVLRTAER